MNSYNFTERVRKVLQMARQESVALRHEYVGTEHILLAICDEGGGVANTALTNLGVDTSRIRGDVLTTVTPGKADGSLAAAASSSGIFGAIADTIGFGRPAGDLPYTSRAKKVLELAMSEAHNFRHSYVGTEHLLIALVVEKRGIAAQILTSHGLTPSKLRDEVLRILGPDSVPTSALEPRRPSADEREAAFTLVVEHPDGRIEAKKFHRAGDAVNFLNALEY
jgi:ATP-dependent Clp protease ATP-binding subunit ClpC